MTEAAPSIEREAPVTVERAVAEYGCEGELRYLSHHDELRMLVRALVRARWPLAYSRGFNPLPRVALPLPRRTGIAATCQVALIDLVVAEAPETLYTRLAAALPAACHLQRVIAPTSRATPHAERVTYELPLTAAEATVVVAGSPRMLAAESLPQRRADHPKRPARVIDIRPYVERIELDGLMLRLELRIADQQTARPSEVLTELGLAAEACEARLRRGEIRWDMEFAGPCFGPAPRERTYFGNEDNE